MKKILCILLIAALCFSMAACAVQPAMQGAVVATVGGVEIRQAELDAYVKRMAAKYMAYGMTEDEFYGDEASRAALMVGVRDALIEQQLVQQLAEEKGLAPYTAEELAALENEGEEELEALRAAANAQKDAGVTLENLLAFLGSTEEHYVEEHIAAARHSRAVQYLTSLVTPTDADTQAYYERMLENQKKVAAEDPHFLGNYAENGTLLYLPEGAAYVEYVALHAELPGMDPDALFERYAESEFYDTAVVFPGSTEFSEELLSLLLTLAVGETTDWIAREEKLCRFRRLEMPKVPATWQELPESLLENVQRTVGEAYLAELVEQAYSEGKVVLQAE